MERKHSQGWRIRVIREDTGQETRTTVDSVFVRPLEREMGTIRARGRVWMIPLSRFRVQNTAHRR